MVVAQLMDESVSNSEFRDCLEDFGEDLRESNVERGRMNQCIERLQSEKQAAEKELDKVKEESKKCDKRIGELEAQVLEANEQMELQKEMLEKCYVELESEYQKSQKANKKFELELDKVCQELSKKTTEFDGLISTLKDACQRNIDLQHQKKEIQERLAKLTLEYEEVNRRLIRKEEFVETLLQKLQFNPGEYYVQCAATNRFLALQVENLLLDTTQKQIPTLTGLIKLYQNHNGGIALYSSLNGMQLKVNDTGEIVTVCQEEKEAGKELEDFEFFQTTSNESGQLIVRSIQTKKFVRVSESLRLCADVADPKNANKFVLKSSAMHLQMVERRLRPNVDYFLKDGIHLSKNCRENCYYCENCFIGMDADQHRLVFTSEANKEPLKLVHNSDRTISFQFQIATESNGDCWQQQKPTNTTWLRACSRSVFLDIEVATKFEPLIGPDEGAGITLRTVQCWDNLYVTPPRYDCRSTNIIKGYIVGSRDKSTKFIFLPVN